MMHQRKTRAAQLLRSIVSNGPLPKDEVAVWLGVSERRLDRLLDGRSRMTLDRQIRLAQLAIIRSPRHARFGYSLLAQAAATISFRRGDTEVHSEPPRSANWSTDFRDA
jgi:hypothetical protein